MLHINHLRCKKTGKVIPFLVNKDILKTGKKVVYQ